MTSRAREIRIDVCVCTFRRPELAAALQSLSRLRVPAGAQVEILVVDNDETPSARGIVAAMRARMPFEVRYVHCPAGNISIARNGALENSQARLLAFIDDDETVDADWLVNLVRVWQARGPDVVLGPVRAIYDDRAPEWMKRLDPHSTEPVFVDGVIETGYSCNVLMDRASAAVRGLRFDLALGRSGGEDTKFFAQVFQRGGRLDYARDATVYEIVPENRQSFRWLVRRRLRMGHTHGRLVGAAGHATARLRQVLLASAKIGYCAVAALAGLPSRKARNAAILRGTLHLGVVLGLLGTASMQHYATELADAADRGA